MRRWRESDREPFAALNADPVVRRYFPDLQDRTASDASIDRMETLFDQQGFGLWALELAGTGEFIGFTGLNPMPPGVPGAGGMEVGWRLAEHAWHHGYATEAALAAVDVAFNGVGLAELWSMTSVLNKPSQAVMRRIGMTPHSHFEHPRIDPGHPLRPHIVFYRAGPAQAGGPADGQITHSSLPEYFLMYTVVTIMLPVPGTWAQVVPWPNLKVR
jgi:RimJ/RimL family protein N-acetyltransferase